MGNKRSARGLTAALAGFVAGYLTALAQLQHSRQSRDERNNRLIAMLHGLVKKHTAAGDDHDEATG